MGNNNCCSTKDALDEEANINLSNFITKLFKLLKNTWLFAIGNTPQNLKNTKVTFKERPKKRSRSDAKSGIDSDRSTHIFAKTVELNSEQSLEIIKHTNHSHD